MGNYDKIDLDFTWDGDYYIGSDGDLADNKDDFIRSLENEIHSILSSEFGDWENHPNLGANLYEFRGEPNTRENGKALEERITSRISAQGIVKQGDINVRVVPVHRNRVLTIIQINTVSTPGNRLEIGESLSIKLLYDSLEDSIFFLPPNDLAKGEIPRSF